MVRWVRCPNAGSQQVRVVGAAGSTSPCRAGDSGHADPSLRSGVRCAEVSAQVGGVISKEPGGSGNLAATPRRVRASRWRSKVSSAPPVASADSGSSGILAVQVVNPLGLRVNVVGVDDSGGWACYSMGPEQCYLPLVNKLITWNDLSPDRLEAFAQYRYTVTVYVGVDIADIAGSEMRYSLDDSTSNCQDPVEKSQHSCYIRSGEDFVVRNSCAFQYENKSRVVIYAMSSSSDRTEEWDHADVDVVNKCST